MKKKTAKIDYKKVLAELYRPSAAEPVIIDVPEMNFIMMDGTIHPGEEVGTSRDFQMVMPVLYGMVYTLKFMLKGKGNIPDSVIMPLEGLWWFESARGDSSDFEISKHNAPWRFTAMIMQPEHITRECFLEAREELKRKKDPQGLERARFEVWKEGLSVQIMHIGPYAEEMPVIKQMHDFAIQQGYELHGKHHEIYMGDPRRTKPEKLKTVLRHPVK
ncbi:GyrI-like domain-containing protein [candidate division WOR-3 bacterium]|nr:GyrI-like domain-containing protein [candidate division WOR-3 bacterium]